MELIVESSPREVVDASQGEDDTGTDEDRERPVTVQLPEPNACTLCVLRTRRIPSPNAKHRDNRSIGDLNERGSIHDGDCCFFREKAS